MAILVTGGTGFIGSHAVVEVLTSGDEVVIGVIHGRVLYHVCSCHSFRSLDIICTELFEGWSEHCSKSGRARPTLRKVFIYYHSSFAIFRYV